MTSKERILLLVALCFVGLFQPSLLLAQSKLLETEQTVNFSSTSLGADFTIHFSSTSLGADKTVRIVKSRTQSDLSIGISNDKEQSTYFFNIVNSSLGADNTINISNTSLGADKTIYITELNLGVDLNIHFTTNLEEADFVISSNKEFLPPKYILAILSSLELLDENNIEIIKSLSKGTKSKSQSNIYENIIESQIDGDFEGWEGETIIKLMNGQIWQQTEYYYHYHYSFMPKVLIYKTAYGYKMKVDDIDKTVGVTRLK